MSLANSEIHQIRTYVQTNCLVKRSWLNKCGERGFLSNKRQCIKLKWLIEYINSGVKEDTTISDSERWVNSMNSNEEDYMDRFNDYQMNQNYSCYHSSSDRTSVQWRKPSLVRCIIYVICGCISMYICTHSLTSMCSNSLHSQRNNHRIRQNMRPYITTRQTVPLQEEIIFLSSPPPPYSPRRTDLENESFASLQPPPYAYAASIAQSNEQGTTPATSPPPYSPSTQP